MLSHEGYAAARIPEELSIVLGAVHIGLYDDVDIIPFDKIEEFYDKYLTKAMPPYASQACWNVVRRMVLGRIGMR